ncbi:hypothetical protein HanPSC8_Chr06g0240041 [Helianthus annuus]|nr:hypothetical protein HanPSC8_Chr06g0240041 [Helianthus annuus]
MAEFCKNFTLQLNQSRPILESIKVNVSALVDVCHEIESEDKYSKPMLSIGLYIYSALSLCFTTIFFELTFNTVLKKKFWVPLRLSSLNAASLTVIAVAMKLPMDLTSGMQSLVDQVAKVGGLGFLCTMMSVSMPSLASLDNKSLFANVMGLSIFVITLIVDVGIQIRTQVIRRESVHPFVMSPVMAACIYMGMLLFLLVIFISSAVTIPTLKKLVELKYQATLNDQNLQERILKVEELRQLLKRHYIMATTRSPQFVLAYTPLSSASSVICVISMVVYISLSWHGLQGIGIIYTSVYKSSTGLIFFAQSVGVLIGSVFSIYRCYAVLRLKSFANQNRNCFSVFKVERYWTQKLCEIDGPSKTSISIWIKPQRFFVVCCKVIELIPIIIIFMPYKSLKDMLSTPPVASSGDDTDEDLSNHVLLPEDDVLSTKYSVKRILDSMDALGKAEQLHNLLKLLEKSIGFEGVETFDSDQIQSLLPVELVNTWSLPILSLTCIAIAIPNIDKDVVDNLLKSVNKGISFTTVVEKSLNKASEYVKIQRATTNLWCEVIKNHKWLDTTSRRSAYQGKAPTDIIKSLAHAAEDIVTEFNRGTNGEPLEKEKLPWKVIAAHSMYRIAQTILHRYESNNLEIIEDELFSRLSAMIADILKACLTNIPRVIMMKCHESAIEKREDSVEDAVCLFVRSNEIIKRLETLELPNMDPEKMGFIDEWRLHFKQP